MDPRFNRERFGTGTKEWADINFNIQKGCSNNCLYCYARADALRFKSIHNQSDWENEIIMQAAVNRRWAKNKGVIMFPTTHDITNSNLHHCTEALKNVLSVDNCVIIVSKPRVDCIKTLCKELNQYKKQIQFRFTIGSLDPKTCHFWEPGAPGPDERLESLSYAYKENYATSVSIEPMLEGAKMAIDTFYKVEPFVTNDVWIGKMRKIRYRVDISNETNLRAVEDIELLQRDEEILRLFERLKNESKIYWKDSIKDVIKQHLGRSNLQCRQ